jgi:hypothetical protein
MLFLASWLPGGREEGGKKIRQKISSIQIIFVSLQRSLTI